MKWLIISLLGVSSWALAAGPNQTGPFQVVTASWLGNASNDALVGADIGADGSVLLAGNSVNFEAAGIVTLTTPSGEAPKTDPKKKPDKNAPEPGSAGFVVRLAADGKAIQNVAQLEGAIVKKARLDEKGFVYLLADSAGGIKAGDTMGSGTFVARLSPDVKSLAGVVFVAGAIDFAIDSNGEFVVLTKGKITRYSPDGQTVKWSAAFGAHGDNRPGGVAISPKSGIAAVTGYGMTHTGKEPYKDPYAYGFDREGKQVWALWNPDPKLQKDAKFGGNGLMADTTGQFAASTASGAILLSLYADGGNSVCTRDPLDVSQKLESAVFDGVFQKGPGYGFKGASKTAVIFRADPASGKLEKGTWMCAWLTKQRANGLGMDDADGDEHNHVFLAGNSASGCPTQSPWYEAPEGGYKGGGFLGIFDKDFKMVQCGYFPGTTMKAVAYRKGVIVIAGSAVAQNKAKDPADPNAAEKSYPVPSFDALQPQFGGGERDGWFAVLRARQ